MGDVSRHDIGLQPCAIARPVSLIGERWTLMLLRDAFRGIRRFEEFQAGLGVSRSLLAERLGALVEAGIFERQAYRDAHRTRHEYQLTQKGRDLYPVLMALRQWGDTYASPEGVFRTFHHHGCGGDAVVRHACDRCGAALTDEDIDIEAGPGLDAFEAATGFRAPVR